MESEDHNSAVGKDQEVESDQLDHSEEDDGQTKKRKIHSPDSEDRKSSSKKSKVVGIDDEAEDSDSDGDSDDDGESDGGNAVGEEDDTNYVADGFVVRDDDDDDSDDEEEDGNEDDAAAKKQRRKLERLKKQRGNVQLDEDDEMLIQENLEANQQKQRRDSEGEEGTGGAADEENKEDREIAPLDPTSTRRSEGGAASGGGGLSALDDDDEDDAPLYRADDDEGSDMGGFIVDEDEEEGDLDGEGGADPEAAAAARQAKRAAARAQQQQQLHAPLHRRTGRREGPTYDQIQEAMNIFGAGFDDFDDEDEEGEGYRGVGVEDEDEDEEGGLTTEKLLEMGLSGDTALLDGIDAGGGGAMIGLSKKDQKRVQRLRSRFEHSQLVSSFLMDRDDQLRRIDRPERMQELLGKRETPSQQERQQEAKWMAGKLAAKMVADRIAVPPTTSTTGVAVTPGDTALRPDMNDMEKEELLKEELVGYIAQVLHFFEVENLEVPFVWTQRRDYLHPTMTVAHLWQIFSWEADWDRTVAIKQRLAEEVNAMADAAEAASGGTAEGDADDLKRMQADMRRLQLQCEGLQSDVQLAEAEVAQAMDYVDEQDEPTQEDRDRVRDTSSELEGLQEKHKSHKEELEQMQEAVGSLEDRLRSRERFNLEAAKETMRLFPVDKYLPIVNNTVDDQELRDVLRFFRLLAVNSAAEAPTALSVTTTTTTTTAVPGGSVASGGGVAPGQQQAMDVEEEDGVLAGIEEKKDSSQEDVSGVNASENAPETRVGEDDVEKKTYHLQGQKTSVKIRRDEYSRYKSIKGLRELVEVASKQVSSFGDAVRHGFSNEPPETPALSCEELAQHLVSSGKVLPLRSVDQVLKAAQLVLATEMSAEPSVRKVVRDLFRSRATVSSRPTSKGIAAITPFSEYFGLHYLHRKPLQDFYKGKDRTLFIRMVEAERHGLITVSIDPPRKNDQNYSKNPDNQRDILDDVQKVMTGTAGQDKDASADGAGRDGAEGQVNADADDDDEVDTELFMLGRRGGLLTKFMPQKSLDDEVYQSSRLSWDTLRMSCLQDCLVKFMFPMLQKEFRRDLIRIGKETIIDEAADRFTAMLKMGPYVPSYKDSTERVKDMLLACPNRPHAPTVASIYLSTGRDDPVCMAFVNKDGTLRAHDLIPAKVLSLKNDRIKQFIVDHRPDVIVLNASGASASRSTCMTIEKHLLREVEEHIKELDVQRREMRLERVGGGISYEDDEDDEEDIVPYKAEVMIVNDDVANIFKNSQRAKRQFPELERPEAAAVCMARYAQEPLAEYCAAWNCANSQDVFGFELLFLNVHPLKPLLRGVQQNLLNALETRLVDAVCEVGVDINQVCTHDHLAPLLAFVGGLGLRKADALRQNVRRSVQTVESRNVLLLKKLLGSNVWTNAAGFIKIGKEAVDPLDNTRIHPECYTTYDFATKICADALEKTHNRDDYIDNVLKLMQSVRRELEKRIKRHVNWLSLWEHGERPVAGVTPYHDAVRTADGKSYAVGVELSDLLSQLELNEYAKALEEAGLGKRKLLFEQLIKEELRYPWLDLRHPLAPISVEETFTLLTGETDQSLYVGLKVGGTVIEVNDTSYQDEHSGSIKRRQRAVVQTDTGLRGFVGVYDIVDDQQVHFETMNIADYLQIGMHVQAVVIGVRKRTMQLDLSVKPSLLSYSESQWMRERHTSKHAQRWWEEMRGQRDLSRLFDRRFREKAALAVCDIHEDGTALKAAGQGSSTAAGGGNKGAASGSAAPGSAGAGGPRTVMRVVHHPLFANLDFKAAEDRLRAESKGAGEILVRPSSRGTNYLTITWAFQENWYKHISVEEKGKRAGDLGLGSELHVMENDVTEPFNDLDEIFSRYIEPMNDLVSVMVNHRSFMKGTTAEVEAAMFAQRKDRPQRIPYFFRYEENKPGNFTLTWLSMNLRNENPVNKLRIEVRPYGLKALGETFARPSDLIVWFKEQQAAAQAKALSAAPSRSSATGSALGGAGTSRTATAGAASAVAGGAPQRKSRWQ
mmetsp:Transcript_22708/g.37888  ORF Transcript_22708/g.37888 Transcript_22708/m.37888 type:complete len:2014 (+) Transcript_22708:62-6103(+)